MTRTGGQACLRDLAREVLLTADARAKAEASITAARRWREERPSPVGGEAPPPRPARPETPVLKRPGDMPRRRFGGEKGRIALLHALAHIELNAIDLAWDLVARFNEEGLPAQFLDDWIAVASDEGRHFLMLDDRLQEFGSHYGDLPAHDGLWQAAMDTAHDLAARLAVVPMVLEARGLDVTPATVARLEGLGDLKTADLLQEIYQDEISHVAAGVRWFKWLAAEQRAEPAALWRAKIAEYFKGEVKPPFNHEARAAADFPAEYYQIIENP